MGRVITLASGKGGTGKTTITANLGIALAQRGLNVCLVDADVAMANLSLLLGMQSSPITLHDVLLGQSSLTDAIYDGPSGLKLVPSGLSLETYRRVDPERMHSVVEELKPQFDFVLLDAPAGIEKTVLSAVSSADEVLLITMPESPAIADVLKMKIASQRLGVRVTGVIINFVRGDRGEISADDIMKMLELPSYGIIPYDDEVRKSFMQEKPVPFLVRKSNCPAAVAIRKVAARITGSKVSTVDITVKKQSFFSKLLSIFRRKK